MQTDPQLISARRELPVRTKHQRPPIVAVALTAMVASAAVSAATPLEGTFVEDFFDPSPALGDTDRADMIAVTNVGTQRIRRFGMYLAAGADANGDGFGLFFDTVSPSHEAPPGPEEEGPGYDGAARFRIDPAGAAATGFVPDSGLFVWFPGTQPPVPQDGDGAVQLVTLRFAHFDPGERVVLGIDVDGIQDFLGTGAREPGIPAGLNIAMGQAILQDQTQVYFDIVSAHEPPEPLPVPGLATWALVLLAIGLSLAYPLLEVFRESGCHRPAWYDGEPGGPTWKMD